MTILKNLTNKLKKFTQDATAKFKEPKSTELESALQKIIIAINNFNSIDVVTEQDIKEFREKIKSIYKSTCLRKYYNPGENDKLTYKRSGLAGIIFQELYIYLTENFRQGVNTAYAPAAGWLSIKDKTKLKEAFKNTYKFKFGSDEAWIESILYNEKVLTKLFHIGQRVQIGQASIPPKGSAPKLPAKSTLPRKSLPPLPQAKSTPPTKQAPEPPKATASKNPQSAHVPFPPVKPDPYFVNGPLSSKPNGVPPKKAESPIKLPSAPTTSKVNHDVLLTSISDIFLSSKFDPKLTPDEQKEFNALKKYFKDNAQAITNKIINIKSNKNRENLIEYFMNMPFSKKMVYKDFKNSIYGKDGLFQEMLKDGIKPNAPIPRNLPKGLKLPPQKQPSKPSASPNMPPPPIPQPTGQGDTMPTAEQLKNANGSLKKITIPTRTKRKSAVEQAFESATNSAMFKQAQQQNQIQDEDDDDAWTD